jgi:hypothetical protein
MKELPGEPSFSEKSPWTHLSTAIIREGEKHAMVNLWCFCFEKYPANQLLGPVNLLGKFGINEGWDQEVIAVTLGGAGQDSLTGVALSAALPSLI